MNLSDFKRWVRHCKQVVPRMPPCGLIILCDTPTAARHYARELYDAGFAVEHYARGLRVWNAEDPRPKFPSWVDTSGSFRSVARP